MGILPLCCKMIVNAVFYYGCPPRFTSQAYYKKVIVSRKFIYAEYNMYHNRVDITTFDGYALRIDCNIAEDRLRTTQTFQCALI